jgi:hypothetical protein
MPPVAIAPSRSRDLFARRRIDPDHYVEKPCAMADADHQGERGEVERLDHPIGERLGLRVVEVLRFGARETLGN